MEIVNRAFKGVWIPKEIWLEDGISWIEKLFLVEIISLSKKDGCYASNKYFSRFFKLSPSRCSKIITSLENKGCVTVTIIYKEDKSISKRIIFPVENRPKKYNSDDNSNINLVSEEDVYY